MAFVIPVLDNDKPADGQTLSVAQITTQARNGQCIIYFDSMNVLCVSYTPDGPGLDSCVYEACDTCIVPNCVTATLSIDVTAP